MATPTAIAAYVALFALTGFLFLFVNLLVGWLVRPRLPNKEKLEVYECGEPTIGSSFVQFDLRFYVVALLFIIFDVEVAFFFPWAAVFGKATQLSSDGAPVLAADLDPGAPAEQASELSTIATAQLRELGIRGTSEPPAGEPNEAGAVAASPAASTESIQQAAGKLAWISMLDILVFFGVLMVGFAYVWKRGDLDWVRSVTRQKVEPVPRTPPVRPLEASQSILSA
jgi:NADH-quinone oxidoreductase subunit A